MKRCTGIKVADLEQSEDYEVLVDEMFMDVPAYSEACIFIHQYNGNVYQSYNDLFGKQISHNFIPTGGCIPFARKMFVTVNGKILACERIGQQYGLGTIEADHSIRLSCEEIARLYNQYYDKLRAQCRVVTVRNRAHGVYLRLTVCMRWKRYVVRALRVRKLLRLT